MAALRLVHRLKNAARRGLHRERMFRDGHIPFEIYDDAEFFTTYRSRRADTMDFRRCGW